MPRSGCALWCRASLPSSGLHSYYRKPDADAGETYWLVPDPDSQPAAYGLSPTAARKDTTDARMTAALACRAKAALSRLGNFQTTDVGVPISLQAKPGKPTKLVD
eukprot:150448-Chlamydomonas_euryale.AAC.2